MYIQNLCSDLPHFIEIPVISPSNHSGTNRTEIAAGCREIAVEIATKIAAIIECVNRPEEQKDKPRGISRVTCDVTQ